VHGYIICMPYIVKTGTGQVGTGQPLWLTQPLGSRHLATMLRAVTLTSTRALLWIIIIMLHELFIRCGLTGQVQITGTCHGRCCGYESLSTYPNPLPSLGSRPSSGTLTHSAESASDPPQQKSSANTCPSTTNSLTSANISTSTRMRLTTCLHLDTEHGWQGVLLPLVKCRKCRKVCSSSTGPAVRE
jgi:hypothetical protein